MSAEIRALGDQFTEAVARHDAAAIASLYGADAQVFPPGSDIVSGRAAIEQFWQAAMDAGIARVALTIEEATAVDGIAFEVGRYTLIDPAGVAIDEGKYVVIWRRDDGGWRIHRDIWNSSRAAS